MAVGYPAEAAGTLGSYIRAALASAQPALPFDRAVAAGLAQPGRALAHIACYLLPVARCQQPSTRTWDRIPRYRAFARRNLCKTSLFPLYRSSDKAKIIRQLVVKQCNRSIDSPFRLRGLQFHIGLQVVAPQGKHPLDTPQPVYT